MHGRDPRHDDDGGVAGWLALLVVLALTAGALVVYRTDWTDSWLEEGYAAGLLEDVFGEQQDDGPPPPEGPELVEPAEPPADPVAEPLAPAAPDAAAVRAALAPRLRDADLGPGVLATVAGLGPDAPVYTRGTGTAIPASTTKLLTGLAALDVLDPDLRFETRTVRSGNRLTLVGGGDPLLAARPESRAEGGTADRWPARADVTTLARLTARRLLADGVRRVRLGYDTTLFTGPAVNPTWRADYVPDGVVAPIGALWTDQGRPASGAGGRVADPAGAAAEVFAAALAEAGVEVAGVPRPAQTPADAVEVAAVAGPDVEDLVTWAVLVSDNEVTEALLRHIGLAVSGEGSTEAGLAGVRTSLGRLGVDLTGLRLYDGSGLSRANRIAPITLVGVLRVAATSTRSELRTLVHALPVAAFSGSLSERFSGPADPAADPAGRGRVRAKTGTLTGVTSLAGIATGVDGTPMVFALMADRIAEPDTAEARDAIDAAAASLGACRCAATAVPGATVSPQLPATR